MRRAGPARREDSMQTFSTKTIFPPYPPHWPYPGGTLPPLRLPASRLGCLALGAAAGFALGMLFAGFGEDAGDEPSRSEAPTRRSSERESPASAG